MAGPYRRLQLTVVGLAGLGLAFWLWQILEPREWSTIELPITEAEAGPWPGDPRCVLDPVVGHRPRSGTRWQTPIASGPQVVETGVLGLMSTTRLPSPVPGPRLLLVGDEQVTDHGNGWVELLEHELRSNAELPTATVLNGGCPGYNLYQSMLRARSLVPVVDPELLIVVVNTGNDFIELDDESRPHLDPNGFEVPPRAGATPAFSPSQDAVARQGAAQAEWLKGPAEQRTRLEHRTQRCLGLLHDLSHSHACALIVVALPSSSHVAGDLASGSLDEWHARFLELCRTTRVASVDLLPPLRAAGRTATDLFDDHRLLASRGQEIAVATIAPRVIRILRLR